MSAPTVAETIASASAAAAAAIAAGTNAEKKETVVGSQAEMSKYGTHEATCDGCNVRPIVGFRYKCTKCTDHDVSILRSNRSERSCGRDDGLFIVLTSADSFDYASCVSPDLRDLFRKVPR